MTRLLGWLLFAVAVAGCGGEDKPIPPLWVGPASHSSPAEFVDAYLVKTSADGSRPVWTILDTGAPFSLLNASAFDRGVSSGAGEVGALSVGEVTLWRVPVFAVEGESRVISEGLPMGGILGYSAVSPLRLSFDPRARTVGVGNVPLPEGVAAEAASASIELRGGGTVSGGGEKFHYLPSRIVLDVEIEGRPLRMLLDTGASSVVLAPDVFSPLIADGRPTVESDFSSASSTGSGTVARLHSMSVLGQTVTEIVAVSTSVLAPNFRAIEQELGEPIDGLIGHSFLREFFSVVDYPGAQVSLYRFANRDHVLDDYRRVGISLKSEGTRLVVNRVYAGTVAAQMVTSGQEVLAIDGQPVAELGLPRAELALRGVVGSTREIRFSSATLVLPVEELLPTP